jgi:hypothetical protein
MTRRALIFASRLVDRTAHVIYRILVDNRRHVGLVAPGHMVTHQTLQTLSRGIEEPNLPTRLTPLIGKVFPDRDSFRRALSWVVGQQQATRLWPNIVRLTTVCTADGRSVGLPLPDAQGRRLGGPGYGVLADVMVERGLRCPATTNARLRYYFTELGWRMAGRHVAAEARRLGHLVKVVREKNPQRSRIVYRDPYQMAILPKKGRNPPGPTGRLTTANAHSSRRRSLHRPRREDTHACHKDGSGAVTMSPRLVSDRAAITGPEALDCRCPTADIFRTVAVGGVGRSAPLGNRNPICGSRLRKGA